MAMGALTCSCEHTPTAVSPHPPAAADFQATLTGLDHAEPNSPAALEAHLEYADFLVEQDPGVCGQGLDLAQSQVQVVSANPAAEVVFPGGWARVADLQYRIHRGRAVCTADPLVRQRELQSAVKAAQSAVQAYRDAFDYASMAVAQFNIAATYHALADDNDAIGALEGAIEMDREFGLRTDAQDNYGVLLAWRKQPPGPEQVAQRMRDFPNRSVTLKFGWSPGEALVTINIAHAKVVENQVVHAQSARTFARRIRAAGDAWVVSDETGDDPIDFGVWPRETDQDVGPVAAFRPTLLRFPTIELTASGDFKAVNELAAFARQAAADAQTAIHEHAPQGEGTAAPRLAALRNLQIDFSPKVIEYGARENYELESAMWIGATLQQGMRYQLIAPLPLPGAPHIVVYHQLDFSFTREVPCTNQPTGHSCVELIVRASPQEAALDDVLGVADLPNGESLHYASATTVRIVTDPETLRPYLHETRRYWYITLGKNIPDKMLMESDHSVIAFTYR
jgi:hypothetical protein